MVQYSLPSQSSSSAQPRKVGATVGTAVGLVVVGMAVGAAVGFVVVGVEVGARLGGKKVVTVVAEVVVVVVEVVL